MANTTLRKIDTLVNMPPRTIVGHYHQRSDPPPEAIKEFISYCPDTGEFTWEKRPPRSHVETGAAAGRLMSDGYRQIKFLKRLYMGHRLAWWWVTGEWPDTLIDHEDYDVSNNRFANLRKAQPFQNSGNCRGRRNRDLPKGVSLRCGKYHSRIGYNHRQYYLGSFLTVEEAVKAYNDASSRLFGEFACPSSLETLY